MTICVLIMAKNVSMCLLCVNCVWFPFATLLRLFTVTVLVMYYYLYLSRTLYILVWCTAPTHLKCYNNNYLCYIHICSIIQRMETLKQHSLWKKVYYGTRGALIKMTPFLIVNCEYFLTVESIRCAGLTGCSYFHSCHTVP